MNWNQIAEQIQAKRNQRGLTQEDLGDRIGTSKQYIYKLEKGKSCSVKMLNKIAKALDCELDVILRDR